MTKYKIEILNVCSKEYIVEAETKDEAIEEALDMFIDNEDFYDSIDIKATSLLDDEKTE